MDERLLPDANRTGIDLAVIVEPDGTPGVFDWMKGAPVRNESVLQT